MRITDDGRVGSIVHRRDLGEGVGEELDAPAWWTKPTGGWEERSACLGPGADTVAASRRAASPSGGRHAQQPRQAERMHAATAIHSGSKQSCNPSAVNEPSACHSPARASVTGVATHAIVASSESVLGIARQWQHNFKNSVPIAPKRRIAGLSKTVGTVWDENGGACQTPPVALSHILLASPHLPGRPPHSSEETSPHDMLQGPELSPLPGLKSPAPQRRVSANIGTACGPLSPIPPPPLLYLSNPTALSIATVIGAFLYSGKYTLSVIR